MEKFTLTDNIGLELMEWMHIRGYSYNTIRQYRHTLKQIQKNHQYIDNENLRKIIKKFKHQNQRAVLHMINDYCYDKNFDFVLRIPRIKTKPRKTPEIYSAGEIKMMINSAPKPYDLAIRCIFNIGAGLRVSEMIKLSWGDIRWIDWLQDQENYGIVVIKAAKGSKERVVNIPNQLMKDLYQFAKEENVLNEFRIPNGSMIFPILSKQWKKNSQISLKTEEQKNQYIRQAYDWFRYHIIRKHCEKAIGRRIKVHSLRHSRATYLYEYEKVPIERIQLLLGHADIATTMLYTKVNPISTFEMLKKTSEI